MLRTTLPWATQQHESGVSMNLNVLKAIWIFAVVVTFIAFITPMLASAQFQKNQAINHFGKKDDANNLRYQQGLNLATPIAPMRGGMDPTMKVAQLTREGQKMFSTSQTSISPRSFRFCFWQEYSRLCNGRGSVP